MSLLPLLPARTKKKLNEFRTDRKLLKVNMLPGVRLETQDLQHRIQKDL